MFTIEELRAQAGAAASMVVLAGVAWTVYGALRLVAAIRGDDERVLGLPSLWFLLPVLLLGMSILLAGLRWLWWFGAVHATAERFGVVRDRGWWHVLGWIVPGVNLVVPKRMVNDIWWTPDRGERTPLPWRIRVWWLFWVAAVTCDLLAYPVSGDAERVLDAVFALLLGLSTPFAVWTIRLLTDRVTQPRPVAAEAAALA